MSKKSRKKSNTAEVVPLWDKPKLVAKNDKQKEYINAINNYKIVVGTGVAGSGKSYIASVMAADMLIDPRTHIDKIIIARPNEIEGTRSIGLLPGTVNEKLEPVLAPVTETLKERLGFKYYEYLVKVGKIEFLPLEFVKGRTFNNSFVIIDECEDIEWSLLKATILRIGQNSKLILDGDVRQTAIKRESGLKVLMELEEQEYLPACFIDFDSWEDHCVRSEECAFFGKLFEQKGL